MSSYFWSGIHCVLSILLLIIKLEIRLISFSEDRKKKLNTQIFFKTLLSWHKYNCGKGAAFAQQKAVGRSLCYCLTEKSFPASQWKRMWVNIKNSTPLLCQEHVHLLVQPMKRLDCFLFFFVLWHLDLQNSFIMWQKSFLSLGCFYIFCLWGILWCVDIQWVLSCLITLVGLFL